MDQTVLRKGCWLRRTIVDKYNDIREGDRIGYGPDRDRTDLPCHIDPLGVTVVPKAERRFHSLR